MQRICRGAVYFGKKSGDKFSIAESIKYQNDKMGNICRIDENGTPVVWYKYDALSGRNRVMLFRQCGQ